MGERPWVRRKAWGDTDMGCRGVWGRSCCRREGTAWYQKACSGGPGRSVQLGKAPYGDLPLGLRAHRLLQLDCTTTDEAESWAHWP